MNGAQYFFARAQHYFTLASEATDAREKKAFEALATELWFKSIVLSRQDRLVDSLHAATLLPLLHTERMTQSLERPGGTATVEQDHETICAIPSGSIGCNGHRIWADRRRHFCGDHHGRQFPRLTAQDDLQLDYLEPRDGG